MKYKKLIVNFFLILLLTGCSTSPNNPVRTLQPATRREYVDNFIVMVMPEDGQNITSAIMDIHGNIVIEDESLSIEQFNQYGLAVVVSFVDEKIQTGIIDMDGNFIVPLQNVGFRIIEEKNIIIYTTATDKNSDENMMLQKGLMDFDGNIILPAEYDEIVYINEYSIFVKENGIWKIIDLAGNVHKILEGITYVQNEGDGLVAFATTDQDNAYPWLVVKGQWGYMDLDGNIVLPEQYDEANTFYEGRAFVWIKDKDAYCGGYLQLIDKQGNVIKKFEGGYVTQEGVSMTGFSEMFETGNVETFQDGIAIVNPGFEGEGYGVMDTDGKWIIEPKYLVWYDEGIITLARDCEEESETYEYYNTSGELLFELDWPCAISKNGYVFYMEEENIYLMDREGNTVLQIPDGYIPDDAYAMWSRWKKEHE